MKIYYENILFLVNQLIDGVSSGERILFSSIYRKLNAEGDTNAYMALVTVGKRPLYTRKDVYKDEKGHWYKK